MGTDRTAYGHTGTKSKGSRPKAARFNDAKFVQYELDKAQVAELKGLPNDPEGALLTVNTLIEDGYRLSLKWDAYGECFAAFLQQGQEDGANAGFILTARGSSVFKCIKQLLYKHLVCLEADWSGYVERRGVDSIDD